jgi:putative ABC transport system permease protein
MFDTLEQDVRYAVRQLGRDRGFTAVAVMTLALGIGSATVMYSVLHNVLLAPFPYADSARLVDVVVRDAERPGEFVRGPLPAAEFLDFQEGSDAFEDVIGTVGDDMVLATKERTTPVAVAWATPNLFAFLGVAPVLGRAFDAADALPGAPPVAVLGHEAWQQHFGGDPAVVGRSILLNREPRTVIGVMPPRFAWHVAAFWLPAPLDPTARDTPQARRWFQARLRPGVSVAEAAAGLNVIAARRAREHPQDYPKRFRVDVITLVDWVVGRFRAVLYTLSGAVALLLLIACVNVANMLLARSTVREREITIRAALGASRGRIIRQLLVEAGLLAVAGGAAGWVVAAAGLGALRQVLPRNGIAYEVEIALNRPVLLFSLAASTVAALVFGLLPALHASRRDLLSGLQQAGRGLAGGFRRGGLRRGLVVGEVALALVLLLGAGLLMRSFLRMVRVDLGFDPSGVVSADVMFPPGDTRGPAAREAYYREVLAAVAALPGVVAVAEETGTPLGGYQSDAEVPGRPRPERRQARFQLCSEGYLRTYGLRLVRGRDLSEADLAGARRVALVSQALVAAHFEGEDPIGRTIVLPRLTTFPDAVQDPTFEIVGVVADVRNAGLGEPPVPAVYLPSTIGGPPDRAIAARTTAAPSLLVEPMRRTIAAVDPGMALEQPGIVERWVGQRLYAQRRFSLIVLASFASIGLLLVGVGVYGVMAYTVAQQRQEIAVRMALGARRREVYGLVLRAGGGLLAGGIAAGLALGLGAGRLIAAQLWNTSPYDPAAVVSAVAVVGGAGLLACAVPATRAVRVDPVAALRSE